MKNDFRYTPERVLLGGMLLFRLLPPAPATQELAWDRLHDCFFFVLTPVLIFNRSLQVFYPRGFR